VVARPNARKPRFLVSSRRLTPRPGRPIADPAASTAGSVCRIRRSVTELGVPRAKAELSVAGPSRVEGVDGAEEAVFLRLLQVTPHTVDESLAPIESAILLCGDARATYVEMTSRRILKPLWA